MIFIDSFFTLELHTLTHLAMSLAWKLLLLLSVNVLQLLYLVMPLLISVTLKTKYKESYIVNFYLNEHCIFDLSVFVGWQSCNNVL